MATVKITDLPYITSLQSNTSNTVLVGVDVPGDYTGQMTLTTLATQLYSNNNLNVGNTSVLFANGIGQFHSDSQPYSQIVAHNQNANGSMDFVATADVGTDTIYYVDMGIQGSNLSQGDLKPLDAYLLAVGNTGTTPGGNLIIGTDTPNKNVDIILGGHETNNVVAQFLYGQGFKLTQKPIIFADGTSQNSAVAYTGVDSRITSNVSTINGSITANAASANSVINTRVSANVATLRGEISSNVVTLNSSISTNIATQNTFAQAAFNKANSALANTSGTFAGNLSVTGNLSLLNGSLSSAGNMTVNGTMLLANSNFSPTESALTITASPTVAAPSNDGYMIHISGKQNVSSRIVTDSYGANTYVVYAGRSARGNVTNPSAVKAGDVLTRISGNGYGTTGFAPLGVGRMDIVASEDHTDSARGTQIQFWNMPAGTNTLTNIATLNGTSAIFTGAISPQKGFIYTPRILTGAQTAITIDFASDAMIRATFNATVTMAFSNYTTGKIVEVWVTNTAGTGQTINLGVLANNSTTGSATLSVASNRSAKLQYFSIDGDLSNTFVAITYA